MNKKILVVAFTFALLFFISAGISYHFGPQIRQQLRLAEWRHKYVSDSPIGEITSKIIPATSVTITDCKPDPMSAFTFLGSTLRFINTDIRNHTIYFKEKNFVIAAGGFTDVPMDFLKSGGDRSYYACDSNKYVGLVALFGTVSSTSTNSTSTNMMSPAAVK